ncbi:hypothetical protein E2C01_079985 [Portunus trituberculatus]|uniref:Uncharacterized protein n=1 Tax=Portunus trituberculatus TaxID=210409 RepID=A0A5B7IIB2_PORTR|nr:hypothetical protein [Portunus trituberculatus]
MNRHRRPFPITHCSFTTATSPPALPPASQPVSQPAIPAPSRLNTPGPPRPLSILHAEFP